MKRFLPLMSIAFVVAAAFGAPARGQAMGKASVDGAGLAPAPVAPVVSPVGSIMPAPSVSSPSTESPVALPTVAPLSSAGSTSALYAGAAISGVTPVPLSSVASASVPAAASISAATPALVTAAASEKTDGPVILPPGVPATAGTTLAAGSTEGSGPAKTPSALEQSSIRRSSEPAAGVVTDVTTPARSGWGNLAQVAGALAVVVGLIFIGRALVRKFVPGAGVPGGKGVIEILARHPLAKNQSIVLVRIGSQIVALNQGREASESVLVISDATEVAKIIGQIEGKNPNSISAGFNNLLANARMDLEQNPEPEAEDKSLDPETLDEQLEEMAAAKRQLMELRQHVRSVRDRMPT